MSKPVNIGIDLRDLKKARTGTFTYLNEIVRAFKKLEKQNQNVRFIYFNYPFEVYTGKNPLLKISEHLLFFLWKQLILPVSCLSNRCDVLFCTDYFVPVFSFGTKTITVFHDCFFFDHPEYYNRVWLKMFRAVGLAGARNSATIITPSVYVQRRLSSLMPELKQKIQVVYEGITYFDEVNNETGSTENLSAIEQFSTGRKIALYVGTLDKRKNLDRLIQAFSFLPEDIRNNLCLVIAGASPAYKGSDHTEELKNIITANLLSKDVLLTGRVSNQMLKDLYQRAWFLVQPSLDEGFGLTIVEAMQFNLPFMAANNTAMPEIGGAAGIYFDPEQVEEIREGMIRMLTDTEKRSEMIKNSAVIRKRYDWDLAAQELMRIFASCLHQK